MDTINNEELCFFTVYDNKTRLPVYTKYNFNFNAYKLYSRLIGNVSSYDLFNKFLLENETDYSKPLTVKNNLVGFFRPMNPQIINYLRNYGYTIHTAYRNYYNPDTYISQDVLLQNQFTINANVYYNDTQIRFIQDFFHVEDLSGKMFTKYNFDFNTYSRDFNVWGSKLQIFTDFISRCIKLVGNTVAESFGYSVPDIFKKYFIDIPDLQNYIINYGITSNLENTYKNPNNIDWYSYGLENKLISTPDIKILIDIKLLKSHYYCVGQFELLKFNFITKPLTNEQHINNFVCTIYSANNYNPHEFFNGFLYNRHNYNGSAIYLVTTFKILKNNPNINTLRAIFSIKNNNELSRPITTIAEFNIIGYDCVSNILVAEYDPNASYNKIRNVDLSMYKKLSISPNYKITNGEQVFSVSNLGNRNLKNLFSGTVADDSYGGSFDSNIFLAVSDEMIINIPETENALGSPVFVSNDITSTNENYTCVGMITDSINKNKINFQTKVINNKFLFLTIQKIISNRELFIANPIVKNNPILLDYYSRVSIPKAWLGTIMSYYNSLLSPVKYSSLINLPYTGGILIEKFIFGINLSTNKIITDAEQLGSFDIIKLDTPLLNSKIYNRYIDSSKTPIVIKSITFFQGLQSEFKTYYFGKYGDQESFYNFTYGMLPIYNKYANDNFFKAIGYYNTIKITYYYYNGNIWVEETEEIGGNDNSWFTSIVDSLGNNIVQHKFQFPFSLLSYQFMNDDFREMI